MKRFITRDVSENVSPDLQLLMWSLTDNMPSKDYPQVFRFKELERKQKIIHSQESDL